MYLLLGDLHATSGLRVAALALRARSKLLGRGLLRRGLSGNLLLCLLHSLDGLLLRGLGLLLGDLGLLLCLLHLLLRGLGLLLGLDGLGNRLAGKEHGLVGLATLLDTTACRRVENLLGIGALTTSVHDIAVCLTTSLEKTAKTGTLRTTKADHTLGCGTTGLAGDGNRALLAGELHGLLLGDEARNSLTIGTGALNTVADNLLTGLGCVARANYTRILKLLHFSGTRILNFDLHSEKKSLLLLRNRKKF